MASHFPFNPKLPVVFAPGKNQNMFNSDRFPLKHILTVSKWKKIITEPPTKRLAGAIGRECGKEPVLGIPE